MRDGIGVPGREGERERERSGEDVDFRNNDRVRSEPFEASIITTLSFFLFLFTFSDSRNTSRTNKRVPCLILLQKVRHEFPGINPRKGNVFGVEEASFNHEIASEIKKYHQF